MKDCPKGCSRKKYVPPLPSRTATDIFSMGRHANEILNSVGGRFERNFNFIGGR